MRPQLNVIFFLLSVIWQVKQSSTAECRPESQKGGVDIFNCSGSDLDSLPELPVRAQVLDFSGNQFREFPVIHESPDCHYSCGVVNSSSYCRLAISFSNNNIDSFETNALHELKCLRTLDLSYNDIKADLFHPAFFEEGVYYLERLNLRGNPLGYLPDNVITHPFMHDLRHLDLSYCELTEIGKNSVDDFPHMKVLDLSYNRLSVLHVDSLKGLRQLDELDLSENRLTFFSEHTFGDLVSLTNLRLSGNLINGFHDDAFYKDSILKHLDLTNNGLKGMPYPALNKLLKLKTMILSQNPIEKVTTNDEPSSVENLIMDEMPLLTELKPNELSSFPNLVSLSISGSRTFTKIYPGALTSDYVNLRHVRLKDNWLTTLESDALPWEQLDSLYLGGNPWMCDDRMLWVLKASCIQGPVICAGPDKLKGKDLKSLASTDLKRDVSVVPLAAIIICLLAIPVLSACVVLVWKRRRFCACGERPLQGRYMTVFTRDTDEDQEARVDVRLHANDGKILSVSNGGADDTKHLVRIEKDGQSAAAGNDEEEEI